MFYFLSDRTGNGERCRAGGGGPEPGCGVLRVGRGGNGYLPGDGRKFARGGVVGTDIAVALRHGIVGGNIPAEGIEHGPAADDAHLGRAAAVPYYARLLSLDGTHEGVGKGVGVDVAVLRVMDGMRLALLGEKFEPYFPRQS